jgi:hypothetical protein
MHQTDAPLFETPCFGATISHVQVFPTHIIYQQRLGRNITVPLDMVASVEQHVHENGFVMLKTTSRQRVICMVRREDADPLCAAMLETQRRLE